MSWKYRLRGGVLPEEWMAISSRVAGVHRMKSLGIGPMSSLGMAKLGEGVSPGHLLGRCLSRPGTGRGAGAIMNETPEQQTKSGAVPAWLAAW